jgi:hypothetical protein
MTNRLSRISAVTLAITLAASAGALAAGPLRGKTYEGRPPASGIDGEGHRVHTHATGNVVLRVAGSGKSVTVRLSSSVPLFYCNTQDRIHVQTTKPASISKSGKFTATIEQRFEAGPGPAPVVQVVSGQFSGRTVRGTIHTRAAECSGVGSFSATAR